MHDEPFVEGRVLFVIRRPVSTNPGALGVVFLQILVLVAAWGTSIPPDDLYISPFDNSCRRVERERDL